MPWAGQYMSLSILASHGKAFLANFHTKKDALPVASCVPQKAGLRISVLNPGFFMTKC